MAYWLIVTILAYLFFGFSSFSDKLVLAGKPNPNSYTFYVGVFGLVAVLIIPFTGYFYPFIAFGFPSSVALVWIVLEAIVHIIGVYTMYVALKKFDVSRVIAIIGATQPVFIFILTSVFFGIQAPVIADVIAFALLLIGSIIISIEKSIKITKDHLKIVLFSSFMFSIDYILIKMVFLNQPFLQGTIWMAVFIFVFVFALLINRNARREIFSKKMVLEKKTQVVFLSAQVFGGVANFLQSFAIYLAPVIFLATINSLRGVQYVSLFLLTLFVSLFYPKILKEEITPKVVIQKIISVVFIASGLAILVLY